MFLCLRKGGGANQAAYWETDSVSPGDYTMRSFGVYPSEERGSRLSQILQAIVHQKYFLSARACAGILKRCEIRHKELPPMLKEALERQARSA